MSELTKKTTTMFTDRIDYESFVETVVKPFGILPSDNMFAAISHTDGSITVTYDITIDD